jgi:hypothetical protein
MDRLFSIFKRTAIIALSAYGALLVLFLASLLVESLGGLGKVPFGLGEYIGNFCMLMYWVQFSFAKLIFGAFPTGFLPGFLKATDPNLLAVFVIGNLLNALLIILVSFCWAAIYSLAEEGDRKLTGRSDFNNGS